jgi:prepilin peptidase dependent protein B
MLNTTQTHSRHRSRRSQRGLSVIELMIGVTLGLFIIGGALAMMLSNINGSRTMLLEARINQDMRATADIIARDLKRSGYWGSSINGVTITFGATAASINPYSSITCTSCINGTSSQIEYGYTKDVTENNALDNTEKFCFRVLNNGVQMQTSNGSWQPITDTSILKITQLGIVETSTSVDISTACATAPSSNFPTLYVRQYDIVLTGQSTTDARIVRTLNNRVRVRNDRLTGACP